MSTCILCRIHSGNEKQVNVNQRQCPLFLTGSSQILAHLFCNFDKKILKMLNKNILSLPPNLLLKSFPSRLPHYQLYVCFWWNFTANQKLSIHLPKLIMFLPEKTKILSLKRPLRIIQVLIGYYQYGPTILTTRPT